MAAWMAGWLHVRVNNGSPDLLPELVTDIEHRIQEKRIVARASLVAPRMI